MQNKKGKSKPKSGQALLVEFFNSPEGVLMGQAGDDAGMTPEQCAVYFLKQYNKCMWELSVSADCAHRRTKIGTCSKCGVYLK